MSVALMAVSSVAVCSVLLGVAEPAFAHPLVDRGRAEAASADFAAALSSFDEAAAGDDLTRRDVALLLEGRALVHHALGDRRSLEQAVAQLAALDATHTFDEAVPPEVVELFRRYLVETAGEVGLDAHAVREPPESVRVVARTANDDAGLVRTVRVFVRADDGPWIRGGRDSRLSTRRGARVDWYAEALGPGGAIVANVGSRGAPRSLRPALEPSDAVEPDGARTGAPLWVWLGGASVALVVGIVLIAVVASTSNDYTQIGGPIVRVPM